MEMEKVLDDKVCLQRNDVLDIEFENVNYFVKESKRKKQILRNVSGKFKAGELTAIMGPSGAGKSTLLNILTGFQKSDVTGSIKVIKQNEKKGIAKYEKKCCYILQDDHLVPLFSVLEIMNIAANLKLGFSVTEKQKSLIISVILDTLKLTTCKDTRCSALSGGQRKRLSIALELIDNRPIMFLDEPTTGLDSLSTVQCIEMLKSLSSQRRTIVCTIHQPSATIFEMFDHVYVLANGYCIYQGDSKNTVAYLSSVGLNCPQYHNPADFLIEVANGEYGPFKEHLSKSVVGTYWRKIQTINSSTFDEDYKSINECNMKIRVKPPTEITRFWILFIKLLRQTLRNWTFTYLRLGANIIIGALLGLLFFGFGNDGSRTISNMSYCMVSIAFLGYTAMMPAVHKFPSELAVLKKERFNNWYQLRTFYAAFLATNIPQQCIFSLIFASSSYYLSGQPLEIRRFGMFATICAMVSIIAECIGVLLGTLVDPINGTFLGAISFATMLCFGGFLIFFPHIPYLLGWLRYFSFLAYAFESLIQSLYGYNRSLLNCPDHVEYCHYKVPNAILNELGMSDMHFLRNSTCLTVYIFLLLVISYFTMKRKVSRN